MPAWSSRPKSSSRRRLIGVGTRASRQHLQPQSVRSCSRLCADAGLAYTRGKTNTVGVYAFDTVDLADRWQLNGGLALGALRCDVQSGGRGGVADDRPGHRRRPVQRQGGPALPAHRCGQRVSLIWIDRHAARHRELHAEQPAEQSEQPERGAAEVDATTSSAERSASTRTGCRSAPRVFSTDNENVILHGRRDGDSADLQPGRRSARQWIHDRLARADHAASGRCSPASGISTRGRSARTRCNNGKRLALTPEFSGSFWTTYALPRGLTLGGGLRYMDEVFVNAPNTIRRAELLAASMRWSSTT